MKEESPTQTISFMLLERTVGFNTERFLRTTNIPERKRKLFFFPPDNFNISLSQNNFTYKWTNSDLIQDQFSQSPSTSFHIKVNSFVYFYSLLISSLIQEPNMIYGYPVLGITLIIEDTKINKNHCSHKALPVSGK